MVTTARRAPGPRTRKDRGAGYRPAGTYEPMGYADGQNLYEYVGSGPTVATDPMGLQQNPTTQPTNPQLATIEEKYRGGGYATNRGHIIEKFVVDRNEGGAIRVSLLPGSAMMGDWWRFDGGGKPCPISFVIENADPVHRMITGSNPALARAVAEAVARRELLSARTHLLGDIYLRGQQEVGEELDEIQAALDAAGMADPSPACDGANALLYLLRGKWAAAGISALAIIPFVGDAGKGRRIAVRLLRKGKGGTEVLEYTARNADEAVAFIRSAKHANRLKQIKRFGSVPGLASIRKGFKSHDELVKFLGRAGDGKAWHHVVEQTPANLRRFGHEAIHNTGNVIAIPDRAGQLHKRISGFYSSTPDFCRPRTVRQWLADQPFEAQFEYGTMQLKRIAKELTK